jgi:hypothetical protein
LVKKRRVPEEKKWIVFIQDPKEYKKIWTRRVREATASFFCVVTGEVCCGPCSVVPHLPLFPFTSLRAKVRAFFRWLKLEKKITL